MTGAAFPDMESLRPISRSEEETEDAEEVTVARAAVDVEGVEGRASATGDSFSKKNYQKKRNHISTKKESLPEAEVVMSPRPLD